MVGLRGDTCWGSLADRIDPLLVRLRCMFRWLGGGLARVKRSRGLLAVWGSSPGLVAGRPIITVVLPYSGPKSELGADIRKDKWPEMTGSRVVVAPSGMEAVRSTERCVEAGPFSVDRSAR